MNTNYQTQHYWNVKRFSHEVDDHQLQELIKTIKRSGETNDSREVTEESVGQYW